MSLRTVRRSIAPRFAITALLALTLTSVSGATSYAASPRQDQGRGHHANPATAPVRPAQASSPERLGSKAGPVAVDPALTSGNVGTAATAPGAERVALRALVIALDASDFGLATWKSTLDRVGTPYDVLLARDEPLTADRLVRADGVGRYNAILLSNNSLLYQDELGNYVSGFDATEWNTLWDYERNYDIRQVSLYTAYGTFPEDYCLRAGSEGGVGDTAINATLTPTGAALFDRLRTDIKIPISLSYVYYSTVDAACGARPILANGDNVLGVLSRSADGRERAALTFSSNQYLPQAYLLTYGLLRWATKGVFVGEQRHYLEVDVDDWFGSTDHLLPDGTYASKEFRISGTDAYSTSQLQNSLRNSYPLARQFAINVAYNGDGINRNAHALCTNLLSADPLTSYSRCLRTQFRWINHTLTHPKMNFTPYAENKFEIQENLRVGRNIGLSVPTPVLKTGEYSGLGVYHPDPTNDIDPPTDYGLAASNAELLAAAKDSGVKYLHGNMSFGSHRPACFNCGVVHPMEPSLMIVPDWPTNIAYHVTTPAEEVTFYNSYYGPNGKFPYWPRDLTYPEIVAWETDIALQHVMSGSAYSHTFHQGNLRKYASTKNLTMDWVNMVAAKFTAYYKVPMLTPTWEGLAGYVANRTTHSGTAADVIWDRTANTLTASSELGGKLFVTGTKVTGGGYSPYGGESISLVSLPAANPVTLTPLPWNGP
ncbi:MAG: hypothetical protein ACRDT4_17245 [Micromonosporaceae bacterium]